MDCYSCVTGRFWFYLRLYYWMIWYQNWFCKLYFPNSFTFSQRKKVTDSSLNLWLLWTNHLKGVFPIGNSIWSLETSHFSNSQCCSYRSSYIRTYSRVIYRNSSHSAARLSSTQKCGFEYLLLLNYFFFNSKKIFKTKILVGSDKLNCGFFSLVSLIKNLFSSKLQFRN